MASKFGYTMKMFENMSTSDLSKLTGEQAKDLRKVVNDALNKRYKRIEKAGLSNVSGSYSQAVTVSGVAKGETPHFTTPRGSTRNEDMRALSKMAVLSKQKTGTVSGTNKYIDDISLGLVGGSELTSGKQLDPETRKELLAKGRELFNERKDDPEFWRAVRGVMDNISGRAIKYDSMDVLKNVSDSMTANPKKTAGEIELDMKNMLDDLEYGEDPIVGYDSLGGEIYQSMLNPDGTYDEDIEWLDEYRPDDDDEDDDEDDEDDSGGWFRWD